MTEQERFSNALDECMTFLLQSPKPSFQNFADFKLLLKEKKSLTEKQIKQIEGTCLASGINIPKNDVENIQIAASQKFTVMCANIRGTKCIESS